MPEYLAPGVYVEEVDTGNKPIEGVSTSTVGFLGLAERGPLDPTLITSFYAFTSVFGVVGVYIYISSSAKKSGSNTNKPPVVTVAPVAVMVEAIAVRTGVDRRFRGAGAARGAVAACCGRGGTGNDWTEENTEPGIQNAGRDRDA